MTVTKKEGLVNTGLASIIISVALFFGNSFLQPLTDAKFGAIGKLGLLYFLIPFLLPLSIIFLILGIYFWVKAFAVKND